jgi:hypothetical protein
LPTGAASAGAFAGLRLYSLTAEPELEPEWLAVAPPATFAPALWVQGFAFTPDGRALVAHRQEQRTLFGPWAPVLLHWHFVPSGDGLRAQSPEPGQTDLPAGAALVRGCLVLAGKWGVCVCAPGAEAPAAVPSSARADDVATGGELVAAAEGQRVRVWSLREPNPVASWPLPYQQAGVALAFSPDGRTLAAGYAGRTVALFDPLAGENRAEYDFGVGPVHSLAFAPDGMTLAVAGRAGLVVVDAE